jgi:hypothetical protein
MTGSQPTASPRLVQALIVVIMVAQGVFASIGLFGGEADGSDGPLGTLTLGLFAAYVATIVAFAFGVWRRRSWAWALAVAAAGLGLALAGLRIAFGEPVDRYLLGMLIDGGLLYYLFKPNVRGIFTA